MIRYFIDLRSSCVEVSIVDAQTALNVGDLVEISRWVEGDGDTVVILRDARSVPLS